jgi:hypothetical protein
MIQVTSSYWTQILAPSMTCAFAMGLLFSPLALAATSGVDRSDAGLASGVLNTARQVGGSLSLAILGTVAADRTLATLRSIGPAASQVAGYQRAFQISALIMLVALAVGFTLPGHTGRASKV